MKHARTSLAALAAAFILLTGAVLGQETAETEQPPETAGAALEEPAETVQMVEVVLENRVVRGRLLNETEESVRLQALAGWTSTYRKEAVQELRRFSLPAHAYYRELAQYYQEQAWDAEDPPSVFLQARRAYRRALQHAESAEVRERLRRQLDQLEADRNEWQQEMLRRQEARKARHEAEMARIEKELARERLESLRRQEELIERLGRAVQQVQESNLRITRALEELDRRLAELEDEVDDLDYRRRHFVRHTVFVDLRRDYQRLEARVDRLESSGGGD
ncbi:MAG: hypothetical protein R6V05_04470 [Candidatus Brocadiia bacterium]